MKNFLFLLSFIFTFFSDPAFAEENWCHFVADRSAQNGIMVVVDYQIRFNSMMPHYVEPIYVNVYADGSQRITEGTVIIRNYCRESDSAGAYQLRQEFTGELNVDLKANRHLFAKAPERFLAYDYGRYGNATRCFLEVVVKGRAVSAGFPGSGAWSWELRGPQPGVDLYELASKNGCMSTYR